MDDFVLVAPEGWIPIDLELFTSYPGVSISAIENWIASQQLPILAQELIAVNLLAPDSTIYAAKIFDGTNLVIMLG